MRVLLQVSEQLTRLNAKVVIYLWDQAHEKQMADLGYRVLVGRNFQARTGDVFLVPEGWPNVISLGVRAGARCVVYCQNWAYLFSGLPDSIFWEDLPVEFLSVSEPVRLFIKKSLGKDSVIIRPYIDETIFYPPPSKPAGSVNIAYMPRKNRALYRQIRQVLESRNRKTPGISWISIDGLGQKEVADKLRESHIFLATGFPEGCPLPPLEAMACGCLTTGFAGFGGWDYMRQAGQGFGPQIPLRSVPWTGNGYFCADWDVLEAALNLEKALWHLQVKDGKFSEIIDHCLLTARSYSRKNQALEISAWLDSL